MALLERGRLREARELFWQEAENASSDGDIEALAEAALGLGGIWVELLSDVAVIPLPADAAMVERALDRLAGAPLLRGGRGRPTIDRSAVARLAAAVGELLLAENLDLVELNPVIAGPDGAIAVDALIRR